MICIYKCPSCGDRMVYDLEKQSLYCNTCNTSCKTEDYNVDYLSYEGMILKEDDIELLSCPSCGAKVMTQEGSAKSKCSFCNEELTAFGVHEGEISPEYIIPCKLSRDQARGKLINWWLSHKSMPELNEQKMKTEYNLVYVPVWLINANSVTTKKIKYMEYSKNRYNSTRTIKKSYAANFLNVPFDSSAKIENDKFHNIEPFNYSEMEEFNSSYLAGQQAEYYQFNSAEIMHSARTRIKKFASKQTRELMDSCIGAGQIVEENDLENDITPSVFKYALVPVWICTYEYQGKKRKIYINGQTGKVAAEVLFKKGYISSRMLIYAITAIILGIVSACGLELHLLDPLKERKKGFHDDIYLLLSLLPILSLIPLNMIHLNPKLLFVSKRESLFRNKEEAEEMQLKQGMKISVIGESIANIGIGVLIIIFAFPAFIRTFSIMKGTHYIIGITLGIILAVFMINNSYTRMKKYESYENKAQFYDYFQATSIHELKIS